MAAVLRRARLALEVLVHLRARTLVGAHAWHRLRP